MTQTIRNLCASIAGALARARIAILSIAITHLLAVTLGIAMAHAGNDFALSDRDGLVSRAHAGDPVSIAYQQGESLRAALIEYGRTLWADAATTLTGLTVFSPYAISFYRGWVGGIVSFDNNHASRLANPSQFVYYLSVVILQLIPYTLAGGAGVNLGLTYFRKRKEYSGAKWQGYPKQALWDIAHIYVLILPLALIANLWEFLSPFN